jgi:hypothetical protein
MQRILSRYPVVATDVLRGVGNIVQVHYARIDHPNGPFEIFATHLAVDPHPNATLQTCPDCPQECVEASAKTWRECQAVQFANYIDMKRDPAVPAILTGDFNAWPGSFPYNVFANRGYIDTYLGAGLPECAATSGVGCTSGRNDTDMSDLEVTASGQTIQLSPQPIVQPNPFAPACGAAPLPVCWASDHDGMVVDVNCE